MSRFLTSLLKPGPSANLLGPCALWQKSDPFVVRNLKSDPSFLNLPCLSEICSAVQILSRWSCRWKLGEAFSGPNQPVSQIEATRCVKLKSEICLPARRASPAASPHLATTLGWRQPMVRQHAGKRLQHRACSCFRCDLPTQWQLRHELGSGHRQEGAASIPGVFQHPPLAQAT